MVLEYCLKKKLVVLFGSTSLRNSFSHRLFLLLQFGGLIFEEKNWVIKLPPNCLRLNQNIAHLSCVFAHCKALKIVSFYSTLSQTLNFAPAFLAPPPSLSLWSCELWAALALVAYTKRFGIFPGIVLYVQNWWR